MGINKSDRNVDEYLASLPADIGDDMRTLDALIRKAVGSDERGVHEGTFWGGSQQIIIGYKMVLFKGKTRTVEWPAIALARQKDSYSIYLSAADDRGYVAEQYGKNLGKVKVGKSSLGFKSLDDIDLKKLADLVARTKKLADKMA